MNPVTAGSTSSPFIVTRRFAVVAGRVAQVAAEEDGIDNVEVDAAGRGVAIRYDTSPLSATPTSKRCLQLRVFPSARGGG